MTKIKFVLALMLVIGSLTAQIGLPATIEISAGTSLNSISESFQPRPRPAYIPLTTNIDRFNLISPHASIGFNGSISNRLSYRLTVRGRYLKGSHIAYQHECFTDMGFLAERSVGTYYVNEIVVDPGVVLAYDLFDGLSVFAGIQTTLSISNESYFENVRETIWSKINIFSPVSRPVGIPNPIVNSERIDTRDLFNDGKHIYASVGIESSFNKLIKAFDQQQKLSLRLQVDGIVSGATTIETVSAASSLVVSLGIVYTLNPKP